MSKKTIKRTVDLANPPTLTDAQKKELTHLQAMPDSEIDYHDIPPLSDEFWENAIRNPLYKPTKTSTTIRVDSDVLLWLKSQGKGYQTRMNRILREAMLDDLEKQRNAL